MKCLLLAFAFVALASPVRGQTANRSPFGDTARIRVITGSDADASPKLLTLPRYPAGARSRTEEARLLVTFVLDSTGRALPSSVRLLSPRQEAFDDAVCAWLEHARFSPDLSRGAPALIVMMMEFTINFDNKLPDAVEHLGQRPDVADLRGQFAALPRHELFERLARAPLLGCVMRGV